MAESRPCVCSSVPYDLIVRLTLAVTAALLGTSASPCNFAEPIEGKVAHTPPHSARQTQGDTRSTPAFSIRFRPVRKFEVLPDGIEERVERNLNRCGRSG